MAVTSETASVSSNSQPEPPDGGNRSGLARLVGLGVVALDLLILIAGTVLSAGHVRDVAFEMVAWAVAAAVVGIAAIQTPAGPQLGLDMPVLLAAGYVLGPIPAGLVAAAGYFDARELRGEITVERALFNRAQTSLSVMAATSVFMVISSAPSRWPWALLAALLAVATDCVVNYVLVAGIMSLHERLNTRITLSRLRVGSQTSFVSTYACLGLLSLLLAATYVEVGVSSLILFATPLVLARQALITSQRLDHAEQTVRVQRRELGQASSRVADERRDERLMVAAGLHDDVLPSLFRVHLLGQVLRQEMANGQLLALEDDLPALVRATSDASAVLRDQIRGLRNSPLGAHGLSATLRLLVRHLAVEATARIEERIDDLSATPVVELLAYQIAREGLRNAMTHARASVICLSLRKEEDQFRLIVEDDGAGFNLNQVDESQHFGIALMRERVELAGGVLQIDTRPGRGTRLIARLPLADPIST